MFVRLVSEEMKKGMERKEKKREEQDEREREDEQRLV